MPLAVFCHNRISVALSDTSRNPAQGVRAAKGGVGEMSFRRQRRSERFKVKLP